MTNSSFNLNRGCIYMLVSPFMFCVVIAVGMIVSNLLTSDQQEETCLQYAREKGVPDLEYMELTGVVIASNQFHGHVCNFKDTRTGYPIIVQFDDEDVPYAADTYQVMSMVVPIICVGVIFSIFVDKIIDRLFPNLARSKPQDE